MKVNDYFVNICFETTYFHLTYEISDNLNRFIIKSENVFVLHEIIIYQKELLL